MSWLLVDTRAQMPSLPVRLRRVDTQAASGKIAPIPNVAHRVRDVAQRRDELRKEALAGFGGRDTASCAVKEPHPQALLERSQVLAQRRGRDAQLRRCAPEIAVSGDGSERGDVAEIKVSGSHCSIRRRSH